MSAPYFYKKSNSNFISIEGKDNLEFLQNIITNDINLCNNNRFLYSCLLTPQGKFSSDFFIFKHNEVFILEIHNFFYEKLIKKLSLYKLRSDITINRLSDIYSYSVFGNIAVDKDTIIFSNDPRNKDIGRKLIHKSDTPTLFEEIKQINENEYHEILIKNTVPNSQHDLEENKSLLLENNFENLNAISWDKGCYVGQELTARMKYRALLKKKLYSLIITNGSVEIGQIIKEDNIEIGRIVNKQNKNILAMLKINIVEKKINTKKSINIGEGTILDFII